jgi:superfamily II DNA or RNA helicase
MQKYVSHDFLHDKYTIDQLYHDYSMTTTPDITIIQKDATFAKVICDSSILMELSDAFCFEVKGAKYSPKFKAGLWDGKKRMLSNLTRLIYIGIVPKLLQYCKDAGYTVDNKIPMQTNLNVTHDIIERFCKSLNLYAHGEPIQIKNYQIDAVFEAIHKGRRTLISPTSSGKSLIAYCIIRWYMLANKQILLLVPNIGLVAQMASDFEDYSTGNKWDSHGNIHAIHGDITKVTDKLLTIANWQAIYKIGKGVKKGGELAYGVPSDYFDKFDIVINDETHLAKAESITGIMERCRNAQKRIGMTGTLNDVDTDKLVIEGLFGPVYIVTTTNELMENGDVTKLMMKCLKIDYPDEVRKGSTKLTYQEEMDFLITHPGRNRFIAKLALTQKENVVIFFRYIDKQGKVLHHILNELNDGSKTIVYIDGSVSLDDREDIRKLISTRNDLILLGNMKCIGTGFNAPNLHIGINASPNKSKIEVLQAIGRLLRLSSGKLICTVYDIFDDLTWKKHENYTYEWFLDRIKYYCEQKFKYKLISVPLEQTNRHV